MRLTVKDKNGLVRVTDDCMKAYPDNIIEKLYLYEEKYKIQNSDRITFKLNDGKILVKDTSSCGALKHAVDRLCDFEDMEEDLPDFVELPISRMEINKDVLNKVEDLIKSKAKLNKLLKELLYKPHNRDISNKVIENIIDINDKSMDLKLQYGISLDLTDY